MREIVLSESFVQNVQKFGSDNNLLDIVQELAMSIDQLSSDLAEQMIYQMLVTQTLVGMDFDSEEINLALFELWRIREERGDKFEAPTARWNFLKHTMEYEEISSCVDNELELGLLMNTIEVCLKKTSKIDSTVSRMERIVEKLDRQEECQEKRTKYEIAMMALFSTTLFDMCTYGNFSERYDYVWYMARRGKVKEFVRAFAAMFVMMANEPLVYEVLTEN